MILDVLDCGWTASTFLVFSSNVFGPLVYYSHMVPLITAFCLGLFVFIKDKDSVIARLFFCITTLFTIWVFSDIVLWADEHPANIMFFWSLLILLEPILYVLGLYFLMAYTNNGYVASKSKKILLALVLPTIILTPTKLGIMGFNYTNCDREVIEGLLVYYGYIVETIITLWAVVYSLRIFKTLNQEKKKPLLIISVGMILFFLSFAWGNIVGSLSEDWTLGQYGLFGMPVFLGFITYAMVRFKTFNFKLIGTQALVGVLWFALLGILFLRTIENVRIIVALTLILFLIIGIQLVRSVKREIEQRERIEKQEKALESANEKLKELDQMKSEFLSLATHQIRSPLTAIKGYASLLLEGEYGKLDPRAKEPVDIIMHSTENLVKIVGEFLDISRIEQGRMAYNIEKFDLLSFVKEVSKTLLSNVEKANIKLLDNMPVGSEAFVNADKTKIGQIIGNLIDNAVKYTPERDGGGRIELGADVSENKVRISVKDNGIGIDPKELDKLFNKFSRTRDAHKTNVSGTGLGLYIAKKMLEAQGGTITVYSEGKGRGSTFSFELPVVK